MPAARLPFTEVTLVSCREPRGCGSAAGVPMPQPGDAGTYAHVDASVEPEPPECARASTWSTAACVRETYVSECPFPTTLRHTRQNGWRSEM
jgi:hypothetical protein